MTSVRLSLTALLLALALAGCVSEPETPPGPTVETEQILPGEYLDNRFFFVDQLGRGDVPGRDPERGAIDLSSLHVFVRQPDGVLQAQDVVNMAAYVDPSGIWTGIDFQTPMYQAFRWREVEFTLRLNYEGEMECIDLGESLGPDQVLGVCYDVVSRMNNILYRVGDLPGRDEDARVELADGNLYYRLKLIKPEWADQTAFTFDYVRRNIYDLGRRYIDVDKFNISIRTLKADDEDPELDEGLLPYIRVFGLDKWNSNGVRIPDNAPDLNNPLVFDLERGLLFFPVDFYEPFNGTQAQYQTNANSSNFFWDGTYLPVNLIPEIYDHQTSPDTYLDYAPFRIDLEFTS